MSKLINLDAYYKNQSKGLPYELKTELGVYYKGKKISEVPYGRKEKKKEEV